MVVLSYLMEMFSVFVRLPGKLNGLFFGAAGSLAG